MRHFTLLLFTTFLLVAAPYRIIDLAETKTHYNTHDTLFVDARDARMYAKGTILRALNISIKRFKRMKKWLPVRKDAPILIFCNGIKCGKSVKLAEKFARAGYTQLMVYREGYPEWKKHKLPIMATPVPCRCDDQPYKPEGKPVVVSGVKLYLAKDDPSRIDARWIVPRIIAGKIPQGVTLVDVRPAGQYTAAHLSGAINVPYDPNKQSIDVSKLPAEGAILFYCNHGAISADAFVALPDEVARRVKVLEADLVCDEKGCRVR
jgi:rhodanese-related sulfurtransferase